jgi:hypothetical protein
MFENMRIYCGEMLICWFRRRLYDLGKIVQGITIAGTDEKDHAEFVETFMELEHQFDDLNEWLKI